MRVGGAGLGGRGDALREFGSLPGFAPLPDLAPLPDIGDFLNDTPLVIADEAVAANPRRLARACGTNAS